MTKYVNGLIYVDWKYMIPKNPKEAFKFIKEQRKPAINRVIEQMEDSPIYTQFIVKETEAIDIIDIK